jgi:hypothetical protein
MSLRVNWSFNSTAKSLSRLGLATFSSFLSGKVHMARNLGSTPGVELAMYIVEKGKPLLVRAAGSQNPPDK